VRVISDFHDYYDSAQQFGQDQTIIYQRKTIQYRADNSSYGVIEVAPPILADTYKKLFARNDDFSLFGVYWHNWSGCVTSKVNGTFYYNHGRVIFCGKVYNYIKFNEHNVFYDIESVKEFFIKNKIEISQKEYKHRKTTKLADIESTLARKHNTIDEKFFVDNKFICVDFNNSTITVNPNLSKLQFYKVFDTFQCFQELDTYICGKLSFPQNVMVEIEDKYRIEQHGFDKHSFRKLPTKKR